jgi:TonB-dependent Receptor Plug Domain
VISHAGEQDVNDSEISESSDTETENETSPSEEEFEAQPEPDQVSSDYETVVRAKRNSREVTRRTVTPEEISKIPGAHGDALIGIQTLPGIARTPLLSGLMFIRGSSPQDSVYFIDSLDSPSVYHFGSVNSIINSDLIEEVEYHPGNFSVRYGRTVGGVIDVTLRAPKTDRFHAHIDADLWDVSVLGEGPVSENWSVAVSARRSYIDAILGRIDSLEDQFEFTVLPRYYDFQIIADYHPHSSDHLKLVVFGSDDKMDLDLEGSAITSSSSANMHTYIYKAQVEWERRVSSKLKNRMDIGFGYWGGENQEGSTLYEWHSFPLNLRDEVAIFPARFFNIRLGADVNFGFSTFDVSPNIFYGPDDHDRSVQRFYAHPALYGEVVLTAIPRMQLVYGVRSDYHSSIGGWGVDPRFSARWEVFRLTTIKGGLGLFQKPPDIHQSDEEYGNSDLDLTSAIHYSLGIEQKIPGYESLSIDLEGFYKDVRRLVLESEDFLSIDGVGESDYSYYNGGTGKVAGLEVLLRHKPSKYFFGWISYTLMKSVVIENQQTEERPSGFDQTHVLNVVGCLSIGWDIDIGLRFRLASGLPYTPIEGASYYGDSDSYNPVDGEKNSARMPLFHQLDVRIDKKWQWKYLALTLYLDVQNVYNQYNPLIYSFNYDGTQKTSISDLPILPSLGLKLEY